MIEILIAAACATAIASEIAASEQRLQLGQRIEPAIGQAGDRGHPAAGDVDEELVPHRAENVVADRRDESGAVEGRRDGFGARGHAAIQFADDRLLAGDAGADATGAEQHAADIGLAGHHPFATEFLGKDVLMAETVLKRHHDRLRADERRGGAHGVSGVIGFDEHDHQVGDGADRGGRCASRELDDGLDVALEHASPCALIASTCAWNGSIRQTSAPPRASAPPIVEPSAPAPTKQIRMPKSSHAASALHFGYQPFGTFRYAIS